MRDANEVSKRKPNKMEKKKRKTNMKMDQQRKFRNVNEFALLEWNSYIKYV